MCRGRYLWQYRPANPHGFTMSLMDFTQHLVSLLHRLGNAYSRFSSHSKCRAKLPKQNIRGTRNLLWSRDLHDNNQCLNLELCYRKYPRIYRQEIVCAGSWISEWFCLLWPWAGALPTRLPAETRGGECKPHEPVAGVMVITMTNHNHSVACLISVWLHACHAINVHTCG